MYPDSVGYDLFANETVKVCAGGRVLVSVELQMIIQKGFFGQISPWSRLATHHGIVAFNRTIDAGYRGIIYVLLFNFSKDDYIVEKGNRIVQIIFLKCENVSFSEVECFDFVSERGTKGFGSCGLYFFLLAIKKMIREDFLKSDSTSDLHKELTNTVLIATEESNCNYYFCISDRKCTLCDLCSY